MIRGKTNNFPWIRVHLVPCTDLAERYAHHSELGREIWQDVVLREHLWQVISLALKLEELRCLHVDYNWNRNLNFYPDRLCFVVLRIEHARSNMDAFDNLFAAVPYRASDLGRPRKSG